MAGVPIEVARQEIWDLVSRSLDVIVFGGSLDVKLLDLYPSTHCIIDVQKHYTARHHNVSLADKTLPPLESGAQYKSSVLSKACLYLDIQKERVHNSLEDARATMGLFQHDLSWILPNIVFLLFFFNPAIFIYSTFFSVQHKFPFDSSKVNYLRNS